MGTFTASRSNYAAPQQRYTSELEEDEMMSIRRVACRLNMDQKTVWHTLHNQQLHLYHRQRVEAMCPEGYVPQVNFC